MFSLTPDNLQKEAQNNPWLARNIYIIEVGQKISLSAFLRKLAELGYTKAWGTRYRGEFSQRGGVVHIFPINAVTPYQVEFESNNISEITTLASYNDTSLQQNNITKYSTNYKQQTINFHSGDYVVHIDHGIGIFRGETEADFIIEYAAPTGRLNVPDLLFVPKNQNAQLEQHLMLLKRVQPYLGIKKPTIHRLGTSVWALTKKKAKEDIVAYAKTLLETIARRHQVTRPPYDAYPEQEEILEASFLHEDTSDQKRALSEIFEDLGKSYPTDRILTGDVGFGKTEVALRAAFRVALNGQQVILLAPTTVLADQHYALFKSRLEQFGIEVRRLTRLENKNEAESTLKGLHEGFVDIVIGTHKILGLGGRTSEFKHPGLLIIDEEQKFGVAHKEYLKKLYPTIDILTLSATPIPRTLYFGLSKIQSFSQISTPPHGRQEIKTWVLPKNQRTIKEAIKFELARGGKIYFLANRIHKIPKLLEEIKELKLRHTKIAVLHGRMREKQIIETMRAFREKKINILVSTTIIENGLDISEANTLIVEDATKLGLAQAHQLRGRVGRGDKEAYAYFLYPSHKLSERAAERLEALERYSWLGAGIEIAKRDLELRGCGNILGRAQSGVAYRVGLNLYFQMLEDAVQKLKAAAFSTSSRR